MTLPVPLHTRASDVGATTLWLHLSENCDSSISVSIAIITELIIARPSIFNQFTCTSENCWYRCQYDRRICKDIRQSLYEDYRLRKIAYPQYSFVFESYRTLYFPGSETPHHEPSWRGNCCIIFNVFGCPSSRKHLPH